MALIPVSVRKSHPVLIGELALALALHLATVDTDQSILERKK